MFSACCANEERASVRQSQDVVTLDALVNGTFEVGDYESSGINGYYGFNYDQLVIPPGGVTIFEVSVSIGHAIFGHGNTSIDFASGDFEAVCPAVLLAILT
jgi:hypothetical protein